MTKKILIMHAYSANNTGDGLLVDKALRTASLSFPEENLHFTVITMYPETFQYLKESYNSIDIIDSGVKSKKFLAFIKTIANIKNYDIVIAVGGGYLRFGTLNEGLKTALAHGPQLIAASLFAPQKTIYLPQSIGPLNLAKAPMRFFLGRMKHVCVRDDRSVEELKLKNVIRMPDMATQNFTRSGNLEVADFPVLTVRETRGGLAKDVQELADLLGAGQFDSYIQSKVASNNDEPVTQQLKYREIIDKEVFLQSGEARVVIAVRLHAALMALAAGHYVIHLAYERKGFGAFDDLNLNEFVYNVFDFDAQKVLTQAKKLLSDADYRAQYNEKIISSETNRTEQYQALQKLIRSM